MTGVLVAIVVVVEDVVVVVVLEVLARATTGVPRPSIATIATAAMVRFAILVMADLSKEYINRTEQSLEIPVNRLNIGCEDRSRDHQSRTTTMTNVSHVTPKSNRRAVPERTARRSRTACD
jgi:hypothetical protein